MSLALYVIEGTWSGYTSAQQRVAHRTVEYLTEAQAAAIPRFIRYTDGTSLCVLVRRAAPRERVEKIDNYTRLIFQCARYGVSSVDLLGQAECAHAFDSARGAS